MTLTKEAAWTLMGWETREEHVPQEYVPVFQDLRCTECLEMVSCHCDDPYLRWTVCPECAEKAKQKAKKGKVAIAA